MGTSSYHGGSVSVYWKMRMVDRYSVVEGSWDSSSDSWGWLKLAEGVLWSERNCGRGRSGASSHFQPFCGWYGGMVV